MSQLLMPWGHQPHSEMECRELIDPHAELFATAYHNAIGKWDGIHADTRTDISKMQRGGVLHDLVVAEIKRQLEHEPQPSHDWLEVCTDEFFKVYVSDTVVLRFKKVPADHIIRLRGQRPNTQRYYKGYGMAVVRGQCTRATVGYVLDSEGHLVDVVVSCQSGETLEWSYSLFHGAPPSAGGVEVLPPEAEIVVDVAPGDDNQSGTASAG